MATIHICDNCKQQISSSKVVRMWGSTKLGGLVFCQECFKAVEAFVMEKFKIEMNDKKYVQS